MASEISQINNNFHEQKSLDDEPHRIHLEGQHLPQHFAHFYSFNNKQHGVWRLYENRKEIVLGIFIAILVFSSILSAVLVVKRRKSRLIEDKGILIETDSQSELSNQSTPVHMLQTLHF